MSLEDRLTALATAIGQDVGSIPGAVPVGYIASPTAANLRDALVTLGLMEPEVYVPAPPENTVAPAISGNVYLDQVLTCSPGTWTNSPTFAYQWRANGTNISGATASTLTVSQAVGVAITCMVTGTNADGFDTAISNAVTVVEAPAPSALVLTSMTGANVLLSNGNTRSGRTGTGSTYAHSRINTPVTGKRYLEFRLHMHQNSTAAAVNVYGGPSTSYPNDVSLGQWYGQPGVAAGITGQYTGFIYANYGSEIGNAVGEGSAWILGGANPPTEGVMRVAIDSATRRIWLQIDAFGWYLDGDPAAGTIPSVLLEGTDAIYVGATVNNNNNWVDVIPVEDHAYSPPAGFTAGL